MKITAQAVKRLVSSDTLSIRKLPRRKGVQLVFFGRKGLYVWRDEERIYLQGGHFLSRKRTFMIRDIARAENSGAVDGAN